MVNLGNIDVKREKILLEGIDFFKNSCNGDELKIIVDDLGVRLYNKLKNDGHVKEDCYTNIDLAVEEYRKRKIIEEYPKVSFIFPSVAKGFGEEENSKIFSFYEKLGVDKNDVVNFKKYITSMSLKTPYYSNEPVLIYYIFQYFSRYNSVLSNANILDFNMDINRYILGIYDIDDDKVRITSNNIYGFVKNNDFLLNVYEKYIEVEKKVNKKKIFKNGSYGVLYTEDIYAKEFINIYPNTDDEKEQLDTLVQYGYLIADGEDSNKYYINSLTCLILSTIFSNYDIKESERLLFLLKMYWREGYQEITRVLETVNYPSCEQYGIISKNKLEQLKKDIDSFVCLGIEYSKIENKNAKYFSLDMINYLEVFFKDYIKNINNFKSIYLFEENMRVHKAKIRQLNKMAY